MLFCSLSAVDCGGNTFDGKDVVVVSDVAVVVAIVVAVVVAVVVVVVAVVSVWDGTGSREEDIVVSSSSNMKSPSGVFQFLSRYL